MSKTIKSRVDHLAIAMVAAIAMILVAGIFVSFRLAAAQDHANIATQALRNHMEADMSHDELRGGIYQAIVAVAEDDSKALADVREEQEENVRWLRQVLQENDALALPPAVHANVVAMRQPINEFVESGQGLLARISSRHQLTNAERREFDEKYEALEGAMSKAADGIEAEATRTRNDVRKLMTAWMVALVIGSLCLLTFTFYSVRTLRRGIVGPMGKLVDNLKKLTTGELDTHVSGTYREDEIGELARGVLKFREAVIATREAEDRARSAEGARLASEKEQAEGRLRRDHEMQDARRRELADMAQALEERVLATAELIASTSNAMRTTSTALAAGATQSRAAAFEANTTSERTSRDAQIVVIATTQMMSAIEEVSKLSAESANGARAMARDSVDVAQKVLQLEQAAEQIGNVTRLIAEIAAKTNMLALNATIEAARAGESGKGFAVVAGEVKTLAEQIGEATSDIGRQIDSVCGTTAEVARAIAGMGKVIQNFDQSSVAIATAIDEQGAAIADINRTVQDSVAGNEQLRTTMEALVMQADVTGDSADIIVNSVHELELQGTRLRQEVSAFIERTRAA